jgi:AraC-like DNA-binding protein
MPTPQILRPLAQVNDPISIKRETWNSLGRGLYDMHYPLEIGLVLTGQMQRKVNGQVYPLSVGKLWLQSMWEPHQTEITATPLELIVIHILPESLRELRFAETPSIHWLSLWSHPLENRVGLQLKETQAVTDCCIHLSQTIGPGIQNKLLRRARLLELLCLLSETLSLGKVKMDTATTLTPALDQLFAHKGRINLKHAAQTCGISTSSFKRLFRQQMQSSYATFALNYRIHGVCQDLIRTQDPIKAIAVNWGFVDSSHLHRHFKDIMQCTPNQYRAEAQTEFNET